METRIVHANATETVGTVDSPALGVSGTVLGVSVDVTAITGTLDVSVQWSPDGTNFGDADGSADALTQFTGTGVAAAQFTVKAPFYRIHQIIGTTSAQYTVAIVSG